MLKIRHKTLAVKIIGLKNLLSECMDSLLLKNISIDFKI